MKKELIFLGPPACGKGTQTNKLAEYFGFPHIDTGSLLRAEIASGSENGKIAKGFIDKGQLVPVELVGAIIKDRLKKDDCKKKGSNCKHIVNLGTMRSFVRGCVFRRKVRGNRLYESACKGTGLVGNKGKLRCARNDRHSDERRFFGGRYFANLFGNSVGSHGNGGGMCGTYIFSFVR